MITNIINIELLGERERERERCKKNQKMLGKSRMRIRTKKLMCFFSIIGLTTHDITNIKWPKSISILIKIKPHVLSLS